MLREQLKEQLLSSLQEIKDFPKPGVIFRDIMPLLRQPKLFKNILESMAEHVQKHKVQHIVGIESRGFLLGVPLATMLDLPFVAARKKGKLPGLVHGQSYALEYGHDVLEIQQDAIKQGESYLIVDDVIATGGSAEAVVNILKRNHAHVAAVMFLIELKFFGGRKFLLDKWPGVEFYNLLAFD